MQKPRFNAASECEIYAFKLFHRSEIIFQIVRKMNKQARNKRHKCEVLSNSVDKNFTMESIETGLAYRDTFWLGLR